MHIQKVIRIVVTQMNQKVPPPLTEYDDLGDLGDVVCEGPFRR